MSQAFLFVHGTGVRAKSYSKSLAVIRAQLLRRFPESEVRGCYWGGAEGARLALAGASIPGYGKAKGGASAEDEELAVWNVLYFDPGYELRLLALRPKPPSGLAPGLPPAQRFLALIAAYQPSPEVVAAFESRDLGDGLRESLAVIAASPELRDAATTIDEDGYEHRHAVARAVLAATLGTAVDEGVVLDGANRDELLAVLGADLHTQGRVLPGAVKKAAAAPALHAMTWQARRRRGALADDSTPAIADILRYQSRGERIRGLIRRTIEDLPGDEVTVIAHSLGGVACVDLLALEDVPRVANLITAGSQAPYFYEVGALTCREYPDELPEEFPRWLNVYDPRDLLSYTAAEVFPKHAEDKAVNNKQAFPYAHSAYWSNKEFWDAVAAWLS